MNRPIADFCSSRLVRIAGWAVALVGASGFAGWVLDSERLKAIVIGGITIKTNTSLCLMAFGGALLLLREDRDGWRKWTAWTLAVFAGAIGLMTFTQHLTGADFGIDQLLFTEPPGERATASPNRMGPPASLSFLIGGIGIVALLRRNVRLAQACAILVAMIAVVSILGYAYGIPPLYGISRFTGIALHTALALLVFAIGLFVIRPDRGFMEVFVSESAGGMMARRLLLPALLLPFVIGWMRTLGEQFGLIDPSLGRPIMIVLLTLILVSLIYRNARLMSALEEQRLAVEREKSSALERTAHVLEQARQMAVAACEQAEQASRAKSEFLATLSHEMRTPLSPVMLTLSEMDKHPAFPPDLRDDLQLMRKSLQLETKLISDLLDHTRIERQKLVLERTDVDLHQVLRDTVHLCADELSPAVTLDLRAANPWVNGDDTRLRQIFWNLLSNAQKFTPPAGRVTIATDQPDPAHVRVRVIDTGSGIGPEMTARLFHAFEQGRAINRQHGGLGLGLSITRSLVEAHGGTISASSPGENQGATFTVQLPALKRGPTAAPKNPVAKEPGLPGLRILLVEDHVPTLGVMRKLLANLGHQVTAATTVAEAISIARNGEFDVLLSDLGLPDGTGHDLIRELGPRFCGRAIALSGYGTESDLRISRELGFSLHLTKPVELSAITQALCSVMEKQRLADAGRQDPAGSPAIHG